MKNRIQLLQKIACAVGIVLLTAGSASADLVYSTDFDISYAATNGATVFDGTTIAPESCFGSGNNVSVAAGDLTLGNTAQNRYRGAGVWLDATAWAAGTVTVTFEASNFTAGTDSADIFQVFAANGVDASNTVSLDLHGAQGLDGDPVATGSATIAMLGTEQTFTGSTTATPSTESLTFTYNGTDQYIALVFANSNAPSTGTGNTVDIDNLTVTTAASIPEPSSLALLGLGSLFLVSRRRHV